MLGQGKQPVAPPYRIDMSDEEFHAVNDVIVCTLAPSKEETRKGVILPSQASPFHVALAVGPKVAEVLGLELEVGDVFAMEGASFADTVAGRVWFCRASKVLSVITQRLAVVELEPIDTEDLDSTRAAHARDTLPPEPGPDA